MLSRLRFPLSFQFLNINYQFRRIKRNVGEANLWQNKANTKKEKRWNQNKNNFAFENKRMNFSVRVFIEIPSNGSFLINSVSPPHSLSLSRFITQKWLASIDSGLDKMEKEIFIGKRRNKKSTQFYRLFRIVYQSSIRFGWSKVLKIWLRSWSFVLICRNIFFFHFVWSAFEMKIEKETFRLFESEKNRRMKFCALLIATDLRSHTLVYKYSN